MSRDSKINRRGFLAAAGTALAAPALIPRTAWAKGRQLKPLPDEMIEKIMEAAPEQPTVKVSKPKKVLVFWRCEGFFHGSINAGNKAMEILGKKTGVFDVVVSDDMNMFNADQLGQFDGVLLNNTTRLKFDEPKRKSLMSFVKDGKGLIGIHAATDNFYDWPEAAAMMGGLFAGHPWGGGGTWAVKIDEPEHPVNKGFAGKGFLVKDELYKFKDPYSREMLRVLVSIDMSKKRNRPGRADGDNAISWIREFEGGRVFYCSLGHNNEIFWNPAILQHYLDGIQYALGDLKADATPSAKLDPKPEPALCPEE